MRPAEVRSGPTGAAGADGEDLREDRQRGLGRRDGADVEAARPLDAVERLLRDAGLEQALTPPRLRRPAAEGADVERVRRERGLERRHVELLVVGQDDDGGVAIGADVRERLLGPLDDDLVGARHALGASRSGARASTQIVRQPSALRGGAERLGGVDRTEHDEARRRPEHLGEDLRPFVLDQAAAADLGRQRREARRPRAVGLFAVEQHDELRPCVRAVDHR